MPFNVLKEVVNPRSTFRKSFVLFHIFRALKLDVQNTKMKKLVSILSLNQLEEL